MTPDQGAERSKVRELATYSRKVEFYSEATARAKALWAGGCWVIKKHTEESTVANMEKVWAEMRS